MPAPQTITFTTPAYSVGGQLPVMIQLQASASSGLPVAYTVTGGAAGGYQLYAPYMTITLAGVYTVTASQSGDGVNWLAASSVAVQVAAGTVLPNRWQVGRMYYPNGPNGIFTQPGGAGTIVYPTQKNSVPWPEYPVVGVVISEFQPIWAPGCLHSDKFWRIIREFDYTTGQSVALITCSVCSYVQRVIAPFEEWLDPIQQAIIIA